MTATRRERKARPMTKRLILLTAVLLAALSLGACAAGAQPAGQGDDKAYSLAFTQWNGERNHELSLEAGDTLQVEIAHAGGDIRLSIHAIDGSAVYRGKGLTSCAFTVEVPASGRYVVTVLGKEASGQVSVKKEGPEAAGG